MGLLDDRVCVITGGAGSVGLASARLFLDEGAKVMRKIPVELIEYDDRSQPDEAIRLVEMTVAENLALGAYARRSVAGPRETLERQLALFPVLAERRNQRADTLSGGEQQMLAIARALMGDPKLLLLDEPSLGLSPRLIKELFSTLRTITRGGQSVLLVEQNVHHSLRLADRVHVLENGRVVRSGTPAELRQDTAIQQAYLGL